MSGKFLFLIFFILTAFNGFSQKIEAETATLSGGASKQASGSASGGYYVAQGEGNLTFTLNFEKEANYNLYIQVASPNGYKANNLTIDGSTVTFITDESNYVRLKVLTYVKLAAGEHTLEITKSWGWVNIDYIEFEEVDPSARFNTNTTLVTPEPMDETKRLYQLLFDNYNQKIISGVSNVEEANWLKSRTGKSPALVGLDYLFLDRGYDSWYDQNLPFKQGKAWAEKNGIVNFHWHWRDPSRITEEFYTDKTDFDITKIFEPNSDEYKAMIKDIDFVSGELKRFQDIGIPVIWRPLHEAAGGWFWWGANGPAACKELWRVMFDRMVNVNGLHNLIWVWTHEPNDADWYPGDEYVDIVGRDIYREGDHSSQVLEFNEMVSLYEGKKMVTISECGSFPDVDNLVADAAGWSWFMPWNGGFVRESKHNPIELWKKVLDSDFVITLDEMPEIKSYTSPQSTAVVLNETQDGLNVYPTYFDNQVTIHSNKTINKLTIYNQQGTIVKEFNLENTTTVINMSNLAAGMYLVKAENEAVVKIFKK